MIYQRFFVGLLVLLIQANLIALGQPNCGNYTSDSAYRANLNATLSSLSTNIGNDGFYNASTGKGPDRANAVVLCKGDLQLNECRECVKEAGAAVMESCPVAKQNIYLGELCTLRYSNESFRGTLATLPRYFVYSDENVTSPEQFKKDLRNLLDDLRGRAAGGSSTRKVAAGNATAPDFQTIFGLVQCTPDLSTEDCTSCLIGAILYIPLCCEESMPTGGAIYVPSCNIRYKTIPFFNTTRLQELEFVPPPPSPPPILEPPPPILEPPPQLSPPGKKNGSTTQTIVIVIVVVVACLIVALSAIIFLRMRKKHKPTKIHQSDISTVESVQYTFSTIKAATNDFSNHNKLGQGGFGAVYKGELPNGQKIAVKRLSRNSGQGDIEFKNEVLLLAKLQHRNLVRLMGFALEGMEKLLVYEFVQNASLDKFIFDSVRRSYLDWDARYKIIGGIARGILYLHEDSRLKIIHRDLKVSNILLDSEMRPKIADFGMARLFGQDETHANTRRIAGTYGYMPPEYLRHGQFSIKSDVYSFGVLVIEIISGHRNYGFQSEDGTLGDLMSFAWKCWQEGRGEEVVEPFLRNGSGSTNEMLRCIHIGLLCVQENAADRPTMASVMLMLSSFSMTLNIPLEPAFYSNGGGGGGGGGCEVLRIGSSRNQASITDLQPR